jgi:hypothetical protein
LEKTDAEGAMKEGRRRLCAPPEHPWRSGCHSRREERERERGEKRDFHPEVERGERIRMASWRDKERLKFQILFTGGSVERIFISRAPTHLFGVGRGRQPIPKIFIFMLVV